MCCTLFIIVQYSLSVKVRLIDTILEKNNSIWLLHARQLVRLQNSGQVLRPTSQCQELSPVAVSKCHLVALVPKMFVEDIMIGRDPTRGLNTTRLRIPKTFSYIHSIFWDDTTIVVVVLPTMTNSFTKSVFKNDDYSYLATKINTDNMFICILDLLNVSSFLRSLEWKQLKNTVIDCFACIMTLARVKKSKKILPTWGFADNFMNPCLSSTLFLFLLKPPRKIAQQESLYMLLQWYQIRTFIYNWIGRELDIGRTPEFWYQAPILNPRPDLKSPQKTAGGN